jgi:hypothetical protein
MVPNSKPCSLLTPGPPWVRGAVLRGMEGVEMVRMLLLCGFSSEQTRWRHYQWPYPVIVLLKCCSTACLSRLFLTVLPSLEAQVSSSLWCREQPRI